MLHSFSNASTSTISLQLPLAADCNMQAGDMGSARMSLGATVHRFKKVGYVTS